MEFAIENGYTPHVLTTQRFPGTAGCLDGRTGLVLFGDNYYRGHIPQPSVACYTCSYRQSYGLAVVVGNKIVEKPHAFHGVNLCFTGYCFVDRWAPINRSIRGEFEITDLLNKISARAIPLNCDWEHYSIPDDYERVRSYVDVSQSR